MPFKHITQKQARDYKRRWENLSGSYPGIFIDNTRLTRDEALKAALARKLGFELILKPTGDADLFNIIAVKP